MFSYLVQGNAIFSFRVPSENVLQVQKDLYVCIVDYERAFDKVRHQDLFEILEEIGVDGKDLRLMKNLYWNQRVGVRVFSEVSDLQHIRRGVRQD